MRILVWLSVGQMFVVLAGGAAAEDGAAGATVEVVRLSDGHLGAGVQIRPGLILTAAHVVGGDATVTIRDDRGGSRSGRVIASDPALDLAAVAIDGDGPAIRVADLSCERPPVGLPVTMVGHPFGHAFTEIDGRVATGERPLGQWPVLIFISREAHPGMSGGPVLAAGAVVGIVVASTRLRDGSPGPAGAVPAGAVCGFMPAVEAALAEASAAIAVAALATAE